jgi:hypothetical protein
VAFHELLASEGARRFRGEGHEHYAKGYETQLFEDENLRELVMEFYAELVDAMNYLTLLGIKVGSLFRSMEELEEE